MKCHEILASPSATRALGCWTVATNALGNAAAIKLEGQTELIMTE